MVLRLALATIVRQDHAHPEIMHALCIYNTFSLTVKSESRHNWSCWPQRAWI